VGFDRYGCGLLKKTSGSPMVNPNLIYIHHKAMTDNTLRFCYLENGWTDGELAHKWIEKDFDTATKEKANGQT